MFAYYLQLSLRSLRRNVALTALMILAIAFGVGASMTTLTVLRILSKDPIPSKSHDLYYVQLDPRKVDGQRPGEEPPRQSTRRDAEELLRQHRGDKQALMTGGSAAINPDRADLKPFFVYSRWTSRDFFPMFETPFVAGGPWSADDDEHAAPVAVIARSLAEKLYGTTEAVGKTVSVDGKPLRVVGVTDTWRVSPHFYDLNLGAYATMEELWVPWSTSRELHFTRNGSMNCWDETKDEEGVGAPCEWIQYWVELHGADAAAKYKEYLVQYSLSEKAAGRFQREPNVRMSNVMEWLDYNKVVPSDVKLQTYLAFAFLLVCLINTVGLLLTKFLRRAADIGVRRALGASKRSIFLQLLVESGAIGLAGGIVGLGLAYLGLWAVRQQPTHYAQLAHMDTTMLAATFALSIAASLLAGLLPAWRGCQITPAVQLKSH
ncbi:MAG TPA: ABC transporter permease [Kofleriaceae bacterium]|nr:ABC transporter permease [Kofleriaceae bacterium]